MLYHFLTGFLETLLFFNLSFMAVLKFILILFIFLATSRSMQDLALAGRSRPACTLCVEVWNLNHQTPKEVPKISSF